VVAVLLVLVKAAVHQVLIACLAVSQQRQAVLVKAAKQAHITHQTAAAAVVKVERQEVAVAQSELALRVRVTAVVLEHRQTV
jgi:hypothetical protein